MNGINSAPRMPSTAEKRARIAASSSAILIAFTIVSVWPFDEPVRGSDETILMVLALPPVDAAAAGAKQSRGRQDRG